jgi:transketolase
MQKSPQASAPAIERLAIDTIRTLSMDAVEAAKSGHPGTPMALAPAAYALWNDVLAYDPLDPLWAGRDRFVLSCGHASMLLYSVLHLTGVRQVVDGRVTDELAVPMDHIRRFRQLHSRCPGHPEQFETTGVETTTGPLGQGIGNSVGMAIAERWLAAHFNRPGFKLFDYNVYAMCSDGDLMEGVATRRLRWRATSNSPTSAGSTTTTTSRSRATRRWPSAKTWPRGLPGWAGTWSRWPTPTTWRPCAPPTARSTRRRIGRP